MLWFKSGDLRGVRTLVDLSSAVDPTVHRSSLNLDSGAPLVKLHDAANKREKLFYALQRYAVSDGEWKWALDAWECRLCLKVKRLVRGCVNLICWQLVESTTLYACRRT